MKRTDLEKLKGAKINNQLKQAAVPDRYGRSRTEPLAQRGVSPLMAKLLRKRDQAD